MFLAGVKYLMAETATMEGCDGSGRDWMGKDDGDDDKDTMRLENFCNKVFALCG